MILPPAEKPDITSRPQPFASAPGQKGVAFGAGSSAPIFRIISKSESKKGFQEVVGGTDVVPESEKSQKIAVWHSDKLPHYSGRKHETISAEVYVRSPPEAKPAVINVSTADSEKEKPRWVILKACESKPRKWNAEQPEKERKSLKVRIQSDATVSSGTSKLKPGYSEFDKSYENLGTKSSLKEKTHDFFFKVKKEMAEKTTETLLSEDSKLAKDLSSGLDARKCAQNGFREYRRSKTDLPVEGK
ncbi:unnamed protein product [Gongylonema pulchrum]|uniref:FYB1 protein n=1 Tax=Gongylonema pulchrum TaxID=637853 RepID=A0A183DFG4_9BILA|nr:unnamed protein product [Gongylonema pulchrum]